jgi:hypothetical protein
MVTGRSHFVHKLCPRSHLAGTWGARLGRPSAFGAILRCPSRSPAEITPARIGARADVAQLVEHLHLGTSLDVPRRTVRMGDRSPQQPATRTMRQDRARHPTPHSHTGHPARRPRTLAGDPHAIRTPSRGQVDCYQCDSCNRCSQLLLSLYGNLTDDLPRGSSAGAPNLPQGRCTD